MGSDLPTPFGPKDTDLVPVGTDGDTEFEVAVFRELNARGRNDEIALGRKLSDRDFGHGPEGICRVQRVDPDPSDRETVRKVADVICMRADGLADLDRRDD